MGEKLGQHFLNSQSVLEDIVKAGCLEKADHVLEIGPGKGVLTEALLGTGAKVTAVELDIHLIALLTEKFASEVKSGQLTLVHEDIMSFDPNELKAISYKLIANIPYYITGAIIRLFLESEHQPSTLVLLIQKEVAERIISKNKKESILSLSVKAYGDPEIVREVSKDCFSPPPKIDSAVLRIRNISKNFFNDIPEERFFSLIKLGFSSKRKKLVNNLSSLYNKAEIIDIFDTLTIPHDVRAEDLPLNTWKGLVNELKKVERG